MLGDLKVILTRYQAIRRIDGLYFSGEGQREKAHGRSLRGHRPDPGIVSDEGLATYLKSVQHYKEESRKAGVDVVMQNHPLMYPLPDMLDQLSKRRRAIPIPSSWAKPITRSSSTSWKPARKSTLRAASSPNRSAPAQAFE